MPQLAKVTGTLWATRKYPGLEGAKMQVIQPINSHGDATGRPLIAVDTAGAGPGETVLYVTAYEAVIPFWRDLVPIDASIVGIVEHVYQDDPAPQPPPRPAASKSKGRRKATKKKKKSRPRKKKGDT